METRNRKKHGKLSSFLWTLAAVIAVAAAVAAGLHMLDRYQTEQDKKAYPIPENYASIAEENAARYDIPLPILYAVIRTESGFNERAVSGAGAMGLMQIMPDTFTWLQSKTGEAYDTEALYQPEINIRYGCYLLHMLYEEFQDWPTVWAAYNAGINRVRAWLRDPEYAENGCLVTIPIEETRRYVKKVESAAAYYEKLYFSTES